MKELIVVAGAIAQRNGHGGHTWALLQYVIGFRELGYDVLLIDWLDRSMCRDQSGNSCQPADSVQANYLRKVMADFRLDGNYCCLTEGRDESLGLSRRDALERVRQSRLLLNIGGYLKADDLFHAAPLCVLLDIDPGWTQMWSALGLHDAIKRHDAWCTVGLNIGRPECLIPTCGVEWVTTVPPVVLSHWPVTREGNGRFTTIATWRNAMGTIEFEGRKYGSRVHEFRKFFTLPSRTNQSFELALQIDAKEVSDLQQLSRQGWLCVSPNDVADDAQSFQHYVQSSHAEYGVAQNMYVQSRSGWFSDRTACYLASGKPAIVQETGFGDSIKTGVGLLTYSTLEEAEECLKRVAADYARHQSAARALAERTFDSNRVLSRLLEQLS